MPDSASSWGQSVTRCDAEVSMWGVYIMKRRKGSERVSQPQGLVPAEPWNRVQLAAYICCEGMTVPSTGKSSNSSSSSRATGFCGCSEIAGSDCFWLCACDGAEGFDMVAGAVMCRGSGGGRGR